MNPKDKRGHYVRSGTRPTVPAIWFAVRLHVRLSGEGTLSHVTRRDWESAEIAVTRRTRVGWSGVSSVRVSTPEAMRDWIHEHSLSGRVNWVVCDRVDELLTLSNWWNYAEARGLLWRKHPGHLEGTQADSPGCDPVILERVALTPTVGIFQFRDKGRLWRMVGADQLRIGAGDAGDSGGSVLGVHPPGDGCDLARREGVAGRVTLATLRNATALSDWWRLHAKAGFGCTVGQLAVGLLRSHTPPNTLCTHKHEETHRLERDAAFGGRASVWYVGAVGGQPSAAPLHTSRSGTETRRWEEGPITQFDVKSMYPSIMRDCEFPYRRIRTRDDVSPRELDELVGSFAVIAKVTIRTRRAEYPYRSGERVVYPVGTFLTTLCGPELATLRTDGEVIQCHRVTTYHRASVLNAVAQYLLELRRTEDCTSAAGQSGFAKLLVNALAGKLAQRAGGWVRDSSRDRRGEWGESYVENVQTGVRTRFRRIAGLCWRWEDETSGAGPHTSAFAYLASYGRVMMRRIRDQLPERSVVSQDTDGLWCLPRGTVALQSCPDKGGGAPGQLCIEGSADTGRWYTARHYQTDGLWTLAGMSRFAPPEDDGTVWDIRRPLPWQARLHTAPDCTHEVSRKSKLSLSESGGTVQPDGWILPRNMLPRKEGSDAAL
jgi:hypothetical protein